jgi:hypothetical protein
VFKLVADNSHNLSINSAYTLNKNIP